MVSAGDLKNFFPSLMLRSPLHPIMSGKYTIIEFRGRRSGRQYATPVAYVREGDRVLLSTDSAWWHNFSEGAPVRLRLRGRTVTGRATAVTDPEAAAAIIRRLVDAIPSYARPAELAKESGRVSDAEIARGVAEGRVGIEVELESPA